MKTYSEKTRKNLFSFIRNFIRCGVVGWCIEIFFTALHSLQSRNMRLTGSTSIWMFPIYGMAAFLKPVSRLVRHRGPLFRGSIYASCIFAAEYWTGKLLWKRNCCPWDYGNARWHVKRLIRLDFAPLWILTGLLFERILGIDAKSPETGKEMGNP